MGQIVFNGQKPKYCNLTAITTGTHATDVPAAGEVWLIDTTNSSKTNGSGKYDKYIIGDNSHTASYLATNALMNIDNAQQIEIDSAPTSGSVNAVSSGGVYQAIQSIDVSGQISGKADKSEMSVVAGTGANADKTTITLKSGTSATVLTQHQDISDVARSGSYNDLADKPNIPSVVTDSTVSGWGFTKNDGTITGITMNGVSKGTSGVVNLGTVITDISGKQDVLTFDSTPTANSTNPVTSGGVKNALDDKADKSITYTKSEVNNLIVPANTEISVVSELPASGVANTIYRVAGTNSYSDYGWDETQFVKLAEYNSAYDAGGALS